MTNKTTKRALLASIVSLVLCFSMLLGTTYAWFTDSAVSGRNIIKSGNLDVVLEYKTSVNGTWAPVTESTKLFKEGALYEPGYTEIVFLRVSNAGSLALKYNLNVNVYGETTSTNVNNQPFSLKDHLEIGYYSMDEYMGQYLLGTMFGTREAAINSVNSTDGSGFSKLSAYNGIVCKDAPLVASTNTNYSPLLIAIVLTMPTTVGNEANHHKDYAAPTIDLGVSLLATQFTSEEDSFGSDYDKDAEYAIGVKTADELADAIENGTTAVSISSDITLNTQLEVNGELTIYGNGNTITAPANGTRVVNVMDNTEAVTVTLVGAKLDATDKERGISFYNNSGDLDVTIIDCEITAKYYGVNVASQNANATLNIKDSTLTGYCAFQTHSPNTVATFDNCVLEGVNLGYNNTQYPYANNFATVVVNSLANNSTLTFNNCTIIATEKESATAPAGQWPATQAHIIDHSTGTTIVWNDCTFIKNGVEVNAAETIN